MPLFILIILGAILASNLTAGYALNSILNHLNAPAHLHRDLALFLGLQTLAILIFIGSRVLGYQPGTGMGRPLLSLIMIWNMLLALPVACLASLTAVVLHLINFSAPLGSAGQTIGLLLVVSPFLLSILATALACWQLNHFRINRLALTIPNLPPALKGFTIAHISDTHIGKLTRGQVLDDLVTATNNLKPDLILLTGDLINMSLEDLPRAIELLRALRAKHGLYLCEGNHDLIESRAGFEAAIQQSGLPFLLNQSATFQVKNQTVQILGLRWGYGMRDERPGAIQDDTLNQLLAERDPGDFTILLAHHPDAFDNAAAAGIPLTLAGHTHGGQLMLTSKIGFGPWLYRYWSGLYKKGDSQLIVSNGTGNWFPLRLNAPAELIHLTLQ